MIIMMYYYSKYVVFVICEALVEVLPMDELI